MSNTQQIEKFIIEFDDLKEEIDSLIDSLKEGISLEKIIKDYGDL